MIPNNACTPRITAAAGTELAGASFSGIVSAPHYLCGAGSSHLTELYDPKAFITHAALLRQGFPHCAKFLTAASRRSLDRVSVPVWLIILSDQDHRCLGKPLPYQQANGTRARLQTVAYM